jgi:hypothetical protein
MTGGPMDVRRVRIPMRDGVELAATRATGIPGTVCAWPWTCTTWGADAADLVRLMAGQFRVPDALRRADHLARTGPSAGHYS